MRIFIVDCLHNSSPLVWDYIEEKDLLKWTGKTTQSKDLSLEQKQSVFEMLEQKGNNIIIEQGTAFIPNARSFLAKVKYMQASKSKKNHQVFDRDLILEQRHLTLKALSEKNAPLWGLTECYEDYFFQIQKQETKLKNLLLKTPSSLIRELVAERNLSLHEIKKEINDRVRSILSIIDSAYQQFNHNLSEDAHKKLSTYFQRLISGIMEYERTYKEHQSTKKRSNPFLFIKQPSNIDLFVDELLKPLSFFAAPTINKENLLLDTGLGYNVDLLQFHLKKTHPLLSEQITALKRQIVQVLETEKPHQKKVDLLNRQIEKKFKEVKGFSSFLSLLTSHCSLTKDEANEVLAEVIRAIKDFYNNHKERATTYLGTLAGGEADFYLSPDWAKELTIILQDKDKTIISDCVMKFIEDRLPDPQIEDINIIESPRVC